MVDEYGTPKPIPPHERVSTTTDAKGNAIKWSNQALAPLEAPSSPSLWQRLSGWRSALTQAVRDALHGMRGGKRDE